jgi:hypothetical protein
MTRRPFLCLHDDGVVIVVREGEARYKSGGLSLARIKYRPPSGRHVSPALETLYSTSSRPRALILQPAGSALSPSNTLCRGVAHVESMFAKTVFSPANAGWRKPACGHTNKTCGHPQQFLPRSGLVRRKKSKTGKSRSSCGWPLRPWQGLGKFPSAESSASTKCDKKKNCRKAKRNQLEAVICSGES